MIDLNKFKLVEDQLLNVKIEKLPYTGEQKLFVYYDDIFSVILNSVAGSGKTASCVGRLDYLVNQKKVQSNKILFFSFTNDAVNELKDRIKNDNIEVTTIHSFCCKVLGKLRLFRPIASFYDFIKWYNIHYLKKKNKVEKSRITEQLYEDAELLSSDISTFKLQRADNIKSKLPLYLKEYQEFLYKEKKMDFADMLILTLKQIGTVKWKELFHNKYDHIFVDEYQDTSSIQMRILMGLKSKQYYLIGDKNQSIYSFSGTNCEMVEKILKQNKETVEFNLTYNFRSAIDIVKNSNTFSSLNAKPTKKINGDENKTLISLDELTSLLKNNKNEVAILVRTNKVIKELERYFLVHKVPLRYFNYFTPKEIDDLKEYKALNKTKNKMLPLLDTYGSEENVLNFILANQYQNKFITTIHKSKGREFHTVVAVNSLSPEIIEENGLEFESKELSKVSFLLNEHEHKDNQCIHYVAVTRPKEILKYMLLDMNDLYFG